MSNSAWIRFRCDLDTDPRVLSIADMIAASSAPYVLSTSARDLLGVTPTVTRNALRDVTLAALFRVWRDANRHTTDGVFKHCTVDHLDTISHIPGFGRAMMHVGWVTEDTAAKTVTLVNFLEMNSPAKGGGSTNAARQARHRQKRNALRNVTGDVTPPVTDPVTVTVDTETEPETDNKTPPPPAQERPRPSGFPATEQQAREIAITIGVDPDYAATVWHEIEGTGGSNDKGQIVTNFASHVKARSMHRQSRQIGQQQRRPGQGDTVLPRNVAYARWMASKEEAEAIRKKSFIRPEERETAAQRLHTLERQITELETQYDLTTT